MVKTRMRINSTLLNEVIGRKRDLRKLTGLSLMRREWSAISGARALIPDIQSADSIRPELAEAFGHQSDPAKVSEVFFYGAGLGNERNKTLLQTEFSFFFPNAKVEVAHDMLAAARATCFEQPGITGILGTGSNSCLYDGKKVVERFGGNGYLFGDEGSGADLGKTLIKQMLDQELSGDLHAKVEQWAGLKVLDIRRKVHQLNKPNVYLAEFARFIGENRNHPEIQSILHARFRLFLQYGPLKYKDCQKLPVHFIGSIAFIFMEELKFTCEQAGIQVGKILRSPVSELLRFHLESAS